MPNLEAEPSQGRGQRRSRRSRREEGRALSSRVAAPLLLAAGLLLLAAAVVPSFLGNKQTADSPDQGEPPVWKSPESDPWSSTSPVWDSKSVRNLGSPSPQDVAVGPGQADNVPAGPATPLSTEPQTVQAQASRLSEAGYAAGKRAEGDIASWRDAGQWPYGNGVGRPQTPAADPGPYSMPSGQTASYELPEGVQGSPIPYVTSSEPGGSASSPYAAPERPQVEMNRSMALGSQDSAPYGESPTGTVRAVQPVPGDYWSNPMAPVYSADARNAARPEPPRGYPSAYPEVAPSGTGFVGDPYRSSESPVGTVIPGSSDAGNYGAGVWPQPQGPGVARLQGVIEKPSSRTTNDYNRSSIY
jgi:hypothetical protein